MKSSDGRKQSLYFPRWMLEEIVTEADELGISVSRVVQDAYRIARTSKRRPRGILIFRDGPKKDRW